MSDEARDAIALYFQWAKRLNDLLQNKQPVPQDLVRDVALSAAQVLYAYNIPSNWRDARPVEPIPPGLAEDIGRHIQLICSGHIPQWILHLQKKGAPPGDPRMKRDIAIAVVYKKLVTRRLINDNKSTAKIANMYKVSRRQVQNWMHEYAYAKPEDFYPEATSDADRAEKISDALHSASARYREWGRGTSNPKPFGKAKPRPSANRMKRRRPTAKR